MFVCCKKTHFCLTFPQFAACAPLILVVVGAATAATGGVATGAAAAVVTVVTGATGAAVTIAIVVTGFIGVTSGAGVMAATPAAAAAAAAVAAAAVAALAADSAAAAAAEMLEMEALGENVLRRGATVSVRTNGMAGTSDILGRATLCKCQIWIYEGLHVSAKQCGNAHLTHGTCHLTPKHRGQTSGKGSTSSLNKSNVNRTKRRELHLGQNSRRPCSPGR